MLEVRIQVTSPLPAQRMTASDLAPIDQNLSLVESVKSASPVMGIRTTERGAVLLIEAFGRRLCNCEGGKKEWPESKESTRQRDLSPRKPRKESHAHSLSLYQF